MRRKHEMETSVNIIRILFQFMFENIVTVNEFDNGSKRRQQ